jgi:hypothetical protein
VRELAINRRRAITCNTTTALTNLDPLFTPQKTPRRCPNTSGKQCPKSTPPRKTLTVPSRSRISLISKSDIKYVGTLHEINSENSTIALENVTSYGTEGRRGDPSQEQPGSDQIYEYIVFRGSDVKELSMVEAPKENQPPAMPNDPAIMGVSEHVFFSMEVSFPQYCSAM